MKKIFLSLILAVSFLPTSSQARTLQLGADLVIPYRVDSPNQRLATMAGAQGEWFLNDSVSMNLTALFGVEDNGFTESPIYFIPGMSLYIPSPILDPFVKASLPILINNGQDIGVQGSAGLLWNVALGLGLEYSVDVAYYFDSEATIINWAHIGAVYTF